MAKRGVFGALSGIVAVNGLNCGSIEDSVDYSGHNIGNYLTNVTSPDECCTACEQTAGCLFWTHVSASQHCYVKTSNAGKRTLSGHVSGSAVRASCGNIEDSVDYSAHNIGNYLTNVTSPDKCCASCEQTVGCLFWTHVNASQHCYVKTSDAGRRTLSGHVSGSMSTAPTPVPPSPSPSPSQVRIAFYSGDGAGGIGDLFGMIPKAAAQSFGVDSYTVTKLPTGADVSKKLTRDAFDIVVFPGGSGSGQSNALGTSGRAAVLDFVRGGGGYIGTCGGAFLGLQHLHFYGSPAPKTIGYPTACHAHGCNTSVGFSTEGLNNLGLKDKTEFKEDVTIMYHNGPIVLQEELPSNVTVLAAFHAQGAPWTSTSQLDSTITIPVNSTAISGIQFGAGRVVLNAPHPEHPPGLAISTEIYAGELSWVLPSDQMTTVIA